MNDRVIDNLATHIAASKNAEYRNRAREHFRVVISFLQTNGLTTRTLLVDGEPLPDTQKIMQSDLTERGFQVMKLGYYKWLNSLDRGRPVEDVSVLERALKKVT